MSLTTEHLTQSECEFCDLVVISRTDCVLANWKFKAVHPNEGEPDTSWYQI